MPTLANGNADRFPDYESVLAGLQTWLRESFAGDRSFTGGRTPDGRCFFRLSGYGVKTIVGRGDFPGDAIADALTQELDARTPQSQRDRAEVDAALEQLAATG